MASILDLAVVALALMVCGTLGLLAWTIGITIPGAIRGARHEVLRARLNLVTAERRVRIRRTNEGDR